MIKKNRILFVLFQLLLSQSGCFWDLPEIVDESPKSWVCGDDLIDERDGKSYKTIQIGNQCWMAQNLNYGEMIEAKDSNTIGRPRQKFCMRNNHELCNSHGALYQWSMKENICPSGWHIPSDREWQFLEFELGMPIAELDSFDEKRGVAAQIGTILYGGEFNAGQGAGFFDPYYKCPPNCFISGNNTSLKFLTNNAYLGDIGLTHEMIIRLIPSDGRPEIGRKHEGKNLGICVRCIKD